MQQLDEHFLDEIGLGTLPSTDKFSLLEKLQKELTERVGLLLSEGMHDSQLEEFERIIDGDIQVIDTWLSHYAPGYQSSERFQRLQVAAGGISADDSRLKVEFAASQWLQIMRPDYQEVVKACMDELKAEIIAQRNVILG